MRYHNSLKPAIPEKEIERKILEVYRKNEADNTIPRIVALHNFFVETSDYNSSSVEKDFTYTAVMSIYNYANCIKKKIKQTTKKDGENGIKTARIELMQIQNESRRIQDLLTFVGIWNEDHNDYLPVGKGVRIGIRRQEILKCLIERVSHVLKSDYVIHNVKPVYFIDQKGRSISFDSEYIFDEEIYYPTQAEASCSLSIDYSHNDSPTLPDNDSLEYIDSLDGYGFEMYCADLLRDLGYENVKVTQGSGDQGIDIIAFKDYIKYGIQCKRYSSDVGNSAIQEANAGKIYYGCNVGVVLTNRLFTQPAKDLAQATGIVLWDRSILTQMLKKRNNGLRV